MVTIMLIVIMQVAIIQTDALAWSSLHVFGRTGVLRNGGERHNVRRHAENGKNKNGPVPVCSSTRTESKNSNLRCHLACLARFPLESRKAPHGEPTLPCPVTEASVPSYWRLCLVCPALGGPRNSAPLSPVFTVRAHCRCAVQVLFRLIGLIALYTLSA